MITFKTLASLIAGGTMLVGAPLSYAASQHGGADAGVGVSVEAGTPEVSQPDAPAMPEAPTVPKAPDAPKAPEAPKVSAPEAPKAPKAPATPDVPTADAPSTPQASVTAGGGSATVGLPTASASLGN